MVLSGERSKVITKYHAASWLYAKQSMNTTVISDVTAPANRPSETERGTLLMKSNRRNQYMAIGKIGVRSRKV